MACCRSLFQYLLKIAWDAEICLQQARRAWEKIIIGSVWSNRLYYCQLSSEDKLGKEKTELKISVVSVHLFIQTQEIHIHLCVSVCVWKHCHMIVMSLNFFCHMVLMSFKHICHMILKSYELPHAKQSSKEKMQMQSATEQTESTWQNGCLSTWLFSVHEPEKERDSACVFLCALMCVEPVHCQSVIRKMAIGKFE